MKSKSESKCARRLVLRLVRRFSLRFVLRSTLRSAFRFALRLALRFALRFSLRFSLRFALRFALRCSPRASRLAPRASLRASLRTAVPSAQTSKCKLSFRMQRFMFSAASTSAGSAERPATPSHLLLISVSMSGDQQKLQVEVTCLVGQLGVVSLGPGRATAWDLVRQVHAEFPPPCGMFWKLVTDNEPMTDKDFVVTEISTVTCVKYAPAEHEHQGAIRAVEELLSKGHSLNTLPLEKHLIWLTMQSLTFGGLFNQSIDDVTLPSGLHSLTFGTFFNQRIDNSTLPSGLQTLTFGETFNHSIDTLTLPSGLQSLICHPRCVSRSKRRRVD